MIRSCNSSPLPPASISRRRTLPSARRSSTGQALASGGPTSVVPIACNTAWRRSALPRAERSSRRQRERMVGSSRPGSEEISRNTVRGGGSSSDFRSALAEAMFSSSALSTMTARQVPVAVL